MMPRDADPLGTEIVVPFARDAVDAAKRSTLAQARPSAEEILAGPGRARVQVDALLAPATDPPDVVEGLYPVDAGTLNGPGEQGKTTLALYEGVHIMLARPLYGHPIARAGAFAIVSAEDDRPTIEGRLGSICRALGLSDREVQLVANNCFIEDVSTRPARLVENLYGAPVRTTFADELIAKYRDAGLSFLHLDPLSLLGAPESLGNDGAAETLRTMRHLSRELRCCVRGAHHVSKEVSRNATIDQYAGRGGSALADNGRFNMQLVRLHERKFTVGKIPYRCPPAVTDLDIEAERVLLLAVHKHSYRKKRPAPIVLVRDGFRYDWHDALRADAKGNAEEAQKRLDVVAAAILAFIRAEAKKIPPQRHTANSLEAARARIPESPGRNELRDALVQLLNARRLHDVPRPPGEVRGAAKTYLSPEPAEHAPDRE